MSSENTASEGPEDNDDNNKMLFGPNLETNATLQLKRFSVSKLPWRSTKVIRLFAVLDRKVKALTGPRRSDMLF